jgi:septum formation protein
MLVVRCRAARTTSSLRSRRALADAARAGRPRPSQVTFRALPKDEIERYVAIGECLDKAGGYGIQDKAAAFVQHLEGSYSGVMGLPLFETAELLARLGFPVL